MDGLDALIPQVEALDIDGQQIEVRPLRVRQLSAFARAVGPLLDEYEAVRQHGGIEAMAAEDWRSLIQDRADDVIAALAVALEKPPAWVGDLYLDGLMRLVASVVRVNADFFARRMMPVAMEAMAAMVGRSPSTASSAPDTSTPPNTP